jgi:MATE family multidrug resistance protein
MGAVGSAWATFGARVALMVFSLAYIARMPEARSLGVFARPPRDRKAEGEQRRIGYAAGASYAIEVGAFAGMNVVAGWLGGLAVAAYAVVLNITAVIFMVPLGLASATAVLVGRAYGARRADEVVRAGLLGFGVCTVLAGAIALMVWPSARLLTSAYTTDPAPADPGGGRARALHHLLRGGRTAGGGRPGAARAGRRVAAHRAPPDQLRRHHDPAGLVAGPPGRHGA